MPEKLGQEEKDDFSNGGGADKPVRAIKQGSLKRFVGFDRDKYLEATGNKVAGEIDFFIQAVATAHTIYISSLKQTYRRAVVSSTHGSTNETGCELNYNRYIQLMNRLSQGTDQQKPVLSERLLEDIQTSKLPGATFSRAVEDFKAVKGYQAKKDLAFEANNEVPLPIFTSKIDILYTQMQDAARRSCGEAAEFHFYDASNVIVRELHTFYTQYPRLIPDNITLLIHKVNYSSQLVINEELQPDIRGEGPVLSPVQSDEAYLQALASVTDGVANSSELQVGKHDSFAENLVKYHSDHADEIGIFQERVLPTFASQHLASLAFDECLYQNGALLQEEFSKEFKGLGIKDVYVGTSRQTEASELAKIKRKQGRSYARFEGFVEAYNEENPNNPITLHKGLTQDIHLRQKTGTTFEAVKRWVASNNAEAVWEGDNNNHRNKTHFEAKKNNAPTVPIFSRKFEILYAQMRDAAFKYSGRLVIFDFYDDSKIVLKALHAYYELHSDLMPANMTLQLHRVEDNVITYYGLPIKSTRTAVPQIAADVYQRETAIGMRMALAAAKADCNDTMQVFRNEVTLDVDAEGKDSLQAGEVFAKTLKDNELAIRRFSTSLTSGLKVGIGIGFSLFFVSAIGATYALVTAFIAAGATASASVVLVAHPVALAVAFFVILALAIGIASTHYVKTKTTPHLLESCFLKGLSERENQKHEGVGSTLE